MSDLRISELPSLASADLASGDWLAVADRSASETRKITTTDFMDKAVTLVTDSTIPSGKILFTTGSIPGGSIANGAINDARLASQAVTASKLADNSSATLHTTLPLTGAFAGQIAVETSTNKASIWNGSSWVAFKAAGSVNSVSVANTAPFNFSITASGDVRQINAALSNSTAAGQFLAGPTASSGAVTLRAIAGGDLPTATSTTKGAVIVNGNGLTISSDIIRINNTVTAESTNYHVVQYNAQGLVTAGRTILGSDVPRALAGSPGVISPGSGLATDAFGVLNHSNAVTSGTATKVTYDAQGHITAAASLLATDIPDLPAEKLTSGTLSGNVFGTKSIAGTKLADNSITKIGGANSTAGIVQFPTADYAGQYFFDSINGDLYLWDGNAWQPITITSGEIIYAGTFDASTPSGVGKVASVTTAGTALGLTVNGALPAASPSNSRYYLVVSIGGTITSGNAPQKTLAAPDMILSNGSSWEEIDVSTSVVGASQASNITFVPAGTISAGNVQAAIEELGTEKLDKTGGTVTGNLEIGTAGSLTFEGSTANASETTLTVVDPTADRTITLPDVSGTVITSGDTGTVTNTMLAGSIAYGKLSLTGTIVNADVSTSAAIAYSKLNLAGTITNADVSTTAAIAYSKLNLAGTIVNADVNASAAIAYSKLALSNSITNSDINASAAIVDTKLATISTAGKVSGGAITSGTIAGSTAINTTGTITTSGVITDGTGNIRRIPQNAQTGAYTLVAADVGKHISITTGGVTVPASVFSVGDNVTIFNNSTSNQTITQGAGVTLRAGGSTATGNRTLANYGVATVLCVAADVFVITGTGLT